MAKKSAAKKPAKPSSDADETVERSPRRIKASEQKPVNENPEPRKPGVPVEEKPPADE